MVTFKEVKPVVDSIIKAVHPFSVILFGSVAKSGAGQDLDLLVVTDKKEHNYKDVVRVRRCLRKFYKKFTIDPFVIPVNLVSEYYSKGSPFLRLISKEGRVMYIKKDAISQWIVQAEEELKTGEYLLEGGYFKGACYHAQQAIEKLIKAKLLAKGWELEKTHSIERLAVIGKDFKVKFKFSEEEIVFIDSIYRGRYPLEAGLLPLGEPREKDAQKAVTIAKRIFKAAQRV